MNYQKLNKTYESLKFAAVVSQKYYNKPLIITYSGGKDSDVMLRCALDCLEKSQFEVVNNHTTVDAPQTVHHIREVIRKLQQQGCKASILYPNTTMWQLIVDKGMPPTRLARYCCQELKERTLPNRVIATGIRADESSGRKGRDSFSVRGKTKADGKNFSLNHAQSVFADAGKITTELGQSNNELNAFDCTLVSNAKQNNDIMVNPIYEWTNRDVWEFIRERGLNLCELYDMGYDRVGCIGCPEGSYCQKKKQFQDFPKYKDCYIRAFDKMIERRKQKGLPVKDDWRNGTEVFNWWTEEYKHNVRGQLNLTDFLERNNNE